MTSNVEAHWFRRRNGTWGVRFEWTENNGRQCSATMHTKHRKLRDAMKEAAEGWFV